MRWYDPLLRGTRTLAIALLCATLLAATPLAALADCPGNLLTNGGFEEGFSARGSGEVDVANGWNPFWQEGPDQDLGKNHRPEYDAEIASVHGTARIREGSYAQKWGKVYATHHAGIYQQVTVPANSTVRLTAWAVSWSSDYDDPSVSDGGKYSLSVGIDPTGGTDWRSPNIVWSPASGTMDQWVQLAVEAQAQGGTVTAYLRGDAEWPLKHNDAYFDDACLTSSAPASPPTNTPAPTITPGGPTNTPAPTATPRPTRSGEEVVHVVQPGEYLTLIAEQYGVTAEEIADANGIAMDSILSVGQELIIPGTEPTPTPTEAATATPEPSPTEPSEPEGGVISVSVFEDRDGDGLRGDGEPLLSGARIALYTADGALVAEDVVDAAAGPFVQNLPAGAYVIRVENPAGYESVASDEWAATLVDGGEIEVVFGARFSPTATPEPTPTHAPAPTATPEAEEPTGSGFLGQISGYSGILVALLALLLPVGVRLLRGRSY